jgi:hypothetical protein
VSEVKREETMATMPTMGRPTPSSKQKAVKLTPDVIRAVEEARQTLPGRMNFSDVLRQAVDLWLGNAPQVLNPYEFWALKTLRAAANTSAREHAEMLLELALKGAEVGAEWPADLVASLKARRNLDGQPATGDGQPRLVHQGLRKLDTAADEQSA